MSMTTVMAIIVALFLLGIGACVGLVSSLRKRPGLRRRHRKNDTYDGPARRCTDTQVCPHNTKAEVDVGDTMASSTATKVSK